MVFSITFRNVPFCSILGVVTQNWPKISSPFLWTKSKMIKKKRGRNPSLLYRLPDHHAQGHQSQEAPPPAAGHAVDCLVDCVHALITFLLAYWVRKL